MLANKSINEPTNEVKISNLSCSSSKVLNSFFEDLGHSVEDGKQRCLVKFEIESFKDKCFLLPQPMNELVTKCSHL